MEKRAERKIVHLMETDPVLGISTPLAFFIA